MSRQINLSLIEENPDILPEDIQRMGLEALQIIWQTSQHIAQEEVEQIKKRYQQFEAEVLQQRQEALDKVEKVKHEIAVAQNVIDGLTRENKSLQVDLSRHSGELKSAEDQNALLKEKSLQQDYEIKRLTEEVGRSREQIEQLKKRLYEVERQAQQDHQALQEGREDIAVHVHNRERLEQNLKLAIQGTEETKKQLKTEQSRVVVAEAVAQEAKDINKKYEAEIKQLKEERHELKSSLEMETRARFEVEKKLAAALTRVESLETGYKEIIVRMENEIEINKGENAQMRNRLIKAEGALEREKKAVERLETKLAAISGSGAKY